LKFGYTFFFVEKSIRDYDFLLLRMLFRGM
jgi:hypothetical protein